MDAVFTNNYKNHFPVTNTLHLESKRMTLKTLQFPDVPNHVHHYDALVVDNCLVSKLTAVDLVRLTQLANFGRLVVRYVDLKQSDDGWMCFGRDVWSTDHSPETVDLISYIDMLLKASHSGGDRRTWNIYAYAPEVDDSEEVFWTFTDNLDAAYQAIMDIYDLEIDMAM